MRPTGRLDRRIEISKCANDLRKTLPIDDAIECVRARRDAADGEEREDLTFELHMLFPLAERHDEAIDRRGDQATTRRCPLSDLEGSEA